MPYRTRLHFNHIARYDSPRPFDGLTFTLRTDADHATGRIKANLYEQLLANDPDADAEQLFAQVRHGVHRAYRDWGHRVLKALSQHLNYDAYGLHDPQNRFLNAHFYNAKSLADSTVQKGLALVEAQGKEEPVLFVSLDEMILPDTEYNGEVAFSRLFTTDGSTQLGFRSRPGRPPLEQQLERIRSIIDNFHAIHGRRLPVILLEDNVRHAKMLNWVIDLMDEHKVLDNGHLTGISTCFCCASDAELSKINHRGRIIPVTRVVDYRGAQIDVVTPRDLLFDGLVVEVEGGTSRLPGPFMDLSRVFKIQASHERMFRHAVQRANMAFCHAIEKRFAVDLPLKWFSSANAISTLAGHDENERMADVLEANHAKHQKPRTKQAAPTAP